MVWLSLRGELAGDHRLVGFRGDRARHDRMVGLVETMLQLHKELARAKTLHQKNVLQRRVDATDHEIDQLVYELYGLSDKEIAIVEGSGE